MVLAIGIFLFFALNPYAHAVDVCLAETGSTTCATGITYTNPVFGSQETKTYDLVLKNHSVASDIVSVRLDYAFDTNVMSCAENCTNRVDNPEEGIDTIPSCYGTGNPQVILLDSDLADFVNENECNKETGHLVVAATINLINNVDYKSTPMKIATVQFAFNAKNDYDISSAMYQNTAVSFVATKTSGTLLPSHSPFYIDVSDTIAPSSSVTALSSVYGASTFPVTFTASDNFAVVHADLLYLEKNSSGTIIKDWDAGSSYYSTDGTPGTLIFPQTVDFTGNVGSTYCFKSVAYDISSTPSVSPPYGNGDTCARIAKFAILASQKPGNSQQLGLVVLATAGTGSATAAPAMTVTQSSCSATNVALTQTVASTYIGTYTLQSGCGAASTVCANTNEECLNFSAAKLSQDAGSELSLGKMSARFEKQSANDDVFVTAFEETQKTYPKELLPVSPLYSMGPDAQALTKEAVIDFTLPSALSDAQKEKTRAYVLQGNTWKIVPTDVSGKKVSAKTKQLGAMGVFSDFTAPTIANVSLSDNLLEAKILDDGSGVDKNALTLKINNENTAFTYDENARILKAVLSGNVPSGAYAVELEAQDNVRNKTVYKDMKTLTFTPFELQRVFAAPNPVRRQNDISIMLDMDAAHGKLLAAGGMNMKIEIYTLNGKLISSVSGGELPSATKQKIGNAARLKKKMNEGAEFPALPNGVYIFRVSVTDAQGKTISKIGKIVVAR